MTDGPRHESSSSPLCDSRPRRPDLVARAEPLNQSTLDAAVGPDRRAGAAQVAWRRHPLVMLARGRIRRRPPVPARAPTTSRAEMLRRLRELPSGLWSYAWEEDEIGHLGPMAQDLWHTFGPGASDRRIELARRPAPPASPELAA